MHDENNGCTKFSPLSLLDESGHICTENLRIKSPLPVLFKYLPHYETAFVAKIGGERWERES